MAACGRLQHIFEKPLPESPKLLDSLSLSPWKGVKSLDSSSSNSNSNSCRDFYGDFRFNEHHHQPDVSEPSSPSPSQFPPSYSFHEDVLHPETDDDHHKDDKNEKAATTTTTSYAPIKKYTHSDSFSSRNSENLSLCTEGLGFESCDDVEDLISNESSFDFYDHHHQNEEKTHGFSRNVQLTENSCNKESKKATNNNNKGQFPPPISCIGRTGKPWVSFKSFREDGRFILREIRMPTQEFLHACREDGRLRLQFIHSDDEILEEEEEEEGEDEIEEEPDDDDIQEIKEENENTEI